MQPISCHRAEVTFQPDDDIDTLFSHMSQLEAPGQLVARILKRIERLPGPFSYASLPPDLMGDEERE